MENQPPRLRWSAFWEFLVTLFSLLLLHPHPGGAQRKNGELYRDFLDPPLCFKVAQSVADFEGHRSVCENQGVQGMDSCLDMEGMRRGVLLGTKERRQRTGNLRDFRIESLTDLLDGGLFPKMFKSGEARSPVS